MSQEHDASATELDLTVSDPLDPDHPANASAFDVDSIQSPG